MPNPSSHHLAAPQKRLPKRQAARRARTHFASLSSSNEEPPETVAPPAHPAASPAPPASWQHQAPTPSARRPPQHRPVRLPAPLPGGSVRLNLHGIEPLPSVASLMRYMSDLRPKLDYLEPSARERVLCALEVATVAHSGQKRKSGEPFIIHPVAVAAILADMRMDRDCIIAGLLHDTVEDTPVTLEELESLFGHDVRKIVEGETKLTKLAKKVRCDKAMADAAFADSQTYNPPSTSSLAPTRPESDTSNSPPIPSWQHERQKREEEQQKQADNLRAMFMAMTEDVRVIIVKLADRLHNMRTLAHMSVAKQRKISKETLEFFAPLAHRLGMRRIKSELEELSFMYLYPEQYQHLKYEVETMLSRSNFHKSLKNAEVTVKDVLEQDRILYNMIRSVNVIGSTKELYSIYRRMQAGENLSSMLDIGTMRVVVDLDPGVDSNQACYHVLGRIHNLWQPIPKRLKDYIAFPKPNGYRSLHTTVLLGQKFGFLSMEIQIRTAEMHRIAEEGIAAELFTSERSAKGFNLNQNVDDESESEAGADPEWRRRTKGWLISIREYIQEFSSSRDLIDAVRKDLLGNRVFVFTPKGRIIDLPKDSTPVDVAYQIHSDVGDRMIGAKVNGKAVEFDYKLQNADVVRIISSPSAPGPSSEWIGYAKSRTARQKIRQFLRAKDRGTMLDSGRRRLEDEARRLFEPLPSESGLSEVMPRLAAVVSACCGIRDVTTVDDLYIAIAKGSEGSQGCLLERTVLSVLRDRRHCTFTRSALSLTEERNNLQDSENGARECDRTEEPLVEFVLSPCCHPIRGDEVKGVRLNSACNEAVVVHRVGCRHVADGSGDGSRRDVVKLRWAVKLREMDDDAVLSALGAERQHTQTVSQPVRMIAVARDCNGLLSYVSGVLSSMGTSIRRSATFTNPHSLVATLAFELLVRDSYHLRRIIERIEECDEVECTRRLAPNESTDYFPESVPGYRPSTSIAQEKAEEHDSTSLRLLRTGHSVPARELEIEEDGAIEGSTNC
ncbi:putative GTP diphosphokinase RSH1, chloroplastic [Gracilariopsis chorda]|uniref:Putative GTP diphosphokinase RSH1, chloroplastic n=1 Tax=Gracilariopsis chorda TaxID=448386 RepID=A0A2V3IMA6_9FLOR|nr:putative GTP diphosphokinase RSH1, chloroplastic [Gracilariopsis chorda]|eukprot:PXF42250.1 putative GTP diphosphokinase RSH1, chloroplastic [Gracilariopsis chorda]